MKTKKLKSNSTKLVAARRYYWKNRDKILAYCREWYKKKGGIKYDNNKPSRKNLRRRRQQAKQRYLKNREKISEVRRKYRQEHLQDERLKDRIRYEQNRRKRIKSSRKLHYKNTYNLTLKEVQQLKKEAKFRCEICHRKIRLCVDHNHKTKVIRGLLCVACNAGLGSFQDSKFNLLQAIQYLKRKDKMPIERVIVNGKPAYRWGNSGHPYTYKAGNATSR